MVDNLTYKNGIKDGLPIGLGYLSVSFAFGVKASLMGIPPFIALFISMTNLPYAGQLASLDIIATLGSVLELIIIEFVINSRYALMGIALSQKVDSSFSFGKRLLLGAFITDEIYAVSASRKGLINTKYFSGLALLPYLGWSIGTIIGALAGNVLPSIVTSALGIALYAMFIAIVVPPSINEKPIALVVILAGALSCAFYYIPFLNTISHGLAIIISAVIASLIVAWIKPVKQADEEVVNE